MKKNNKVRITDTTLRDGHQSLWATRMRTDDMMGIIDAIDSVGYYSLEVWGGATFDVCLRFLREDPWERLKMLKAKAKKTPLQMLIRGQNIVGYRNYPDDLVDRFVETAHANGIDIFRIFDALNDTRNLMAAIKAVKKCGAHAQGTLSYTISPVHTVKKYVGYAREQAALGVDSICIKDMAGLLSPVKAKELVSALKKEVDIPIQIHCHATSGMAIPAYLEGVKAGAEAFDCAIAAMAGYSSQPPVETMEAVFRETSFKLDIDLDALRKINKYFADLTLKRTKGKGFEPVVDTEILIHQIPGGMISNFRSQLIQQDALEKLPDVLEEVTRVRKDLGYPPLVTPTSQIVGAQAVMNVMVGKRYKVIPLEVKNYIKGLYGRPPGPIDPKFMKKILGDEKPIEHRPADDLEDMLPHATDNISEPDLITNEEDILSYCIFPEVSMEYFKWRALSADKRPKTPADIELEAIPPVSETKKKLLVEAAQSQLIDPILHPDDFKGLKTLLEKASNMQLNELIIKKGDFNLALKSGGNGSSGKESQSTVSEQKDPAETLNNDTDKATDNLTDKKDQEKAETLTEKLVKKEVGDTIAESEDTINAVMAGTFYHATGIDKPPLVEEGSVVNKGDTIFVLEAMKLFNEIKAPFKCKVVKKLVKNGDAITKDQPVLAVKKL
ncbi:MAG: pyruvate carboxylase subunit B [Bacteroidales bacterium]|nr:pyruvate carboxylase subunit B [Bacteroidales bacterium]